VIPLNQLLHKILSTRLTRISLKSVSVLQLSPVVKMKNAVKSESGQETVGSAFLLCEQHTFGLHHCRGYIQDVGKQLDNDEITTRDILLTTWQHIDTENGNFFTDLTISLQANVHTYPKHAYCIVLAIAKICVRIDFSSYSRVSLTIILVKT